MTMTTQPKTTSGSIALWMDNETVTKQIVGALGGYMDADTFKAQCALAARDKNLADCDPQSLFSAFLVCAQMGLLPGKHHGHVALIPRRDRDSGKTNVDTMPQWQGFKFIMEKQDGIKRVTPVLVHDTDEFAFVDGQVHHSFDPFDNDRQFRHPSDTKDGKTGLRGAYLKIEHDDGEMRYHFMGAAAIEKRRMCSQAPDLDKWGKPGVWRNWYAEQCLKTVMRDAWSRRAVSIDPHVEEALGRAAERDDVVLGNDPSRVLPAPQKPTARLTAVMGGKKPETAQEAPQVSETTLAGDDDQNEAQTGSQQDSLFEPTAAQKSGKEPCFCASCGVAYTYGDTNSNVCAECATK